MDMQWEVDARTIRDCPGGRTEVEWREAVRNLEKKLNGTRKCRTCGQSLAAAMKYHITETEEWMPSDAKLPRGRWGLSARAHKLSAAKRLKEFMGPRATIFVLCSTSGNSSTYKKLSVKAAR